MKCLSVFAVLLFSIVSLSLSERVRASDAGVEPALLQSLSGQLLRCAEQPYAVNARTGNKIFGALRSHCDTVVISQDRAELELNGRAYALVIKDSELSDDGDLNDVYLQYDAREDQEVQLASNVLAFGDPALSLLLVTGHKTEELPQVLDPALSN